MHRATVFLGARTQGLEDAGKRCLACHPHTMYGSDFENLLEVTDWVHTLCWETSYSHYPVIAVMMSSFSNYSLGSCLISGLPHTEIHECLPFQGVFHFKAFSNLIPAIKGELHHFLQFLNERNLTRPHICLMLGLGDIVEINITIIMICNIITEITDAAI